MNIVTEVAVCMGYSSLKPLQGEIVSSVFWGRDVFAILPTGYGKSFCFLVFNKLKARDPSHREEGQESGPSSLCEGSCCETDGRLSECDSIVIVVSLLKALLEDQVSKTARHFHDRSAQLHVPNVTSTPSKTQCDVTTKTPFYYQNHVTSASAQYEFDILKIPDPSSLCEGAGLQTTYIVSTPT